VARFFTRIRRTPKEAVGPSRTKLGEGMRAREQEHDPRMVLRDVPQEIQEARAPPVRDD